MTPGAGPPPDHGGTTRRLAVYASAVRRLLAHGGAWRRPRHGGTAWRLPDPGAARRLAGQAGVTLVEILVVLGIVGVMAAGVTASFGGGERGGAVERAARRLATQLALAADEALVTGQSVRMAWDAGGYGFAIGAAAPGARHDLGAVTLEGGAEGGAEGGTPPLLLAADGAGAAAVWRLRRGAQAWQVTFDGLTARATPVAP